MLALSRIVGACLFLGALAARLGVGQLLRRGLHRLLVVGRVQRVRRRRASHQNGLSFGLEVWAALLAAGEPMVGAIEQAAVCGGEQLAEPLRKVRDGLRAGLPSAEAWAGALAGADSPTLAVAADACVRSERDGTSLAPVLLRLAAEERSAATSAGLVAARRAGILAVLPLGLCTLPAYVLLSVAPAVIGLIRHSP